MNDKGENCVFLSISDYSKAYKLYNPITTKIVASRDVMFYEDSFLPWNNNVVKPQIPVNINGINEEE
jgi:hypothetical protein